jgi:hypothetical protein
VSAHISIFTINIVGSKEVVRDNKGKINEVTISHIIREGWGE